ncbi:DVUA0089 family protein [Primorskyibacter sp. S187A]|uniref:DVUA0089 family protein n=1 Tax=Primorskyibacter sp. S187A TaxID=3415130 RepID=UPI003C7B2A75
MALMKSVAASAALLALASAAQAASFSFTGTFAKDNDVQLFDFTVGAESDVVLKTYSYGGGVMADGTVIDAGGFDPILALFDANGLFIDSNDDGSAPDVNADPVTGSEFDTFLEATLAAGNYTVAVMQYDNFALGDLSDGFTYDGPGNETFTDTFGCGNGIFCDVGGFDRTNAWAFDILNVDEVVVTAPVPLPAGLPLLLAGLGGLAMLRRRS